jgi:PTH1 family peptidyl-tRNA hydrolase
MILIVGLGNPGEKYAGNRHNLGFWAVEELAEKEGLEWKSSRESLIAIRETLMIITKPQTFMNASGFAVVKLAKFYKIKPENIWIIHDEIDLPLGKLKIRFGGGTAGHRGIASIMEQLGTDQFARFRLGVGRPFSKVQAGRGKDREVERYVLRNFSNKEKNEIKSLLKRTIEAIECGLKEGLDEAMRKYNR